jgi:hypothetical protein
MENRLTNLTFDQWIRHVFDHEVGYPEWHFEPEADFWDGPPAVTVEYMMRLFNDSLTAVQGYTEAQMNQGLWYIASNACSNCMFAVTDVSVPMPDRIECLRAIFALYRDLLAPRCSPHLGHLSEQDPNPLNSVCYMWWDLVPIVGAPGDPSRVKLDAVILEVMRQTLLLDSPACHEGALHGLGHWAGSYPIQASAIIELFLKSNPTLRPELRRYALAAKTGCVL